MRRLFEDGVNNRAAFKRGNTVTRSRGFCLHSKTYFNAGRAIRACAINIFPDRISFRHDKE